MKQLLSFQGRIGRWVFLGRLIKALALTAGAIFGTVVTIKSLGYSFGLPRGLIVFLCAVIVLTSALSLTSLAIRRGRDIGLHWLIIVALIWIMPIAYGLFPKMVQSIEAPYFDSEFVWTMIQVAIYPILALWPGVPQKRAPDESMAVILR